MLVLQRLEGRVIHRNFRDVLDYVRRGDVLVLNDSRVIPARLRGAKSVSGGQIETLLIEEISVNDWWAMLRPGKRARVGVKMFFLNNGEQPTAVNATVIEKNSEGHCRLQFSNTANILEDLNSLGAVPLPPYITRELHTGFLHDRERYQTVYARSAGSVAAPTAGFHFTDELLEEVRLRGAQICFVTLHVGPGTFAPVKTPTLQEHVMHEERFDLGSSTAQTINEAKKDGRRVIAVGTTTVRVLESVAAANDGRLVNCGGRTRIFIYPPFPFGIVDALITNFHLPQSTLLMLVSAFVTPGKTRGRALVLSAYEEAIREGYRFFSYGDAMLIL
jgi:S-adenosylmethionine:tRNA ribosyltransferase-isomerase